MNKKFEQLISYIINEDETKAKALFHEIVIGKSRDIYEGLQQNMGAETLGTQLEQENDVIDGDETMEGDDEFGDDMDMGDEGSMDGEEYGDEGMGDEGSMNGEEYGDEGMGDEGDVETRVMDLEDALDELKAEFDALMDEEKNEPEHADMDSDMDDEDMDGDMEYGEEGDMDDEDMDGDMEYSEEGDMDDEDKSASVYGESKTPQDLMREYVEKVSLNWPNSKSDGAPVGSGGTNSPINCKSPVISGKNDMGGTTKNIAQGCDASDKDSNNGPKKPSNYLSKGERKMGPDSYENSPGANTKGYKDKRTVKREQEGQTTDGTVPVVKKSFNPGGTPGFKG